MNLFINVIFSHRFWIVMIRRLLFGILFVVICLVGSLFHKKIIYQLILVHQENSIYRIEFIQSVRRIHISPAIEFL